MRVCLCWLRLGPVLTLVIGALLWYRPIYAHEAKVRDATGALRSPVEVVLSAVSAPQPGEAADVVLTVTPYVSVPTVEITWELIDGGELLGGAQHETLTNLTGGQAVQVRRQVRFAGEGIYQVAAGASFVPKLGMPYANGRALFFTVKSDGSSSLSPTDPRLYNPMGSLMQGVPTVTVEEVNPAGTTDELCFTVSGVFQRIERTPTTLNATGYLSDTVAPVRFALVQVREEDVVWDDTLGETLTSANGAYSINFCTEPSIFEGSLELYVRLNAALYESLGGFEVAYVEDSSYIDEMYYYDSSIFERDTSSNISYSPALDQSQSQVFNIADAMYEAWRFWKETGGSSTDSDSNLTAEVHWELNYDESPLNTFYEPANEEITIGTVNDPDAWDESSMMHEYGHLLEDNFSCDESLGGQHSAFQLLDDVEFAWSEGYPNYFQSVARQNAGIPEANIYIDVMPGNDIRVNLETWDVNQPSLVDETNEAAIAALFWDLMDDVNDGQDRATYGHRAIQEVYTGDAFNDQFGDEECSVSQYFQAWQEEGKTADANTAAIITQNVSKTLSFTGVTTELAAADAAWAAATNRASAATSGTDYQWWQHLIMVSDVSQSMAGSKIEAVKSVLQEQVTDIAANSPKGVEFALQTFDNTSFSNRSLVSGKFYADLVTPAINSLTTSSSADLDCPVESLRALTNAIGGAQRGAAWLFTDGDALQNVSTETLIKALNSHQLQGSIALLGGCKTAPANALNTKGATKNYLGKAANASQSGGIVPYLLTAIGSGGQFLFVDPAQINAATEILRAQLSHSAGAGRWSDYVSDQPTYLYDKLNSWEYQWIDTSVAAGGVDRGAPNPQVSVPLPVSFTFYGSAQTNAHVTRYGYLTFGAQAQTAQAQDSPLPSVAQPNNALYTLWGDIGWDDPPAVVAAGANAPDLLQANVFSRQAGEWFVIETNGVIGPNQGRRAYQVLLNATSGEIRYQYQTLFPSEAGIATIGLENGAGTSAVQVSHNDTSAASNGMGYKFTPAPAQPSQTYTVAVDSLMSSVGFLLTGFSGTFDPLAIRTPDNTLISCADTANVLCLNLGLVQYVQVRTNGRNGLWRATVSAGASGSGTYLFSSIGASTLSAESNGERTRSTGAQSFPLKLGRPVTGNTLAAWFTKPNGERFGNPLSFFDDGAHNDGQAGDGRFGSDSFTPPAPGVAYLWVKGTADGSEFTRAEPTPFNFQPLAVTSLGDAINYGDVTRPVFAVHNLDTVKHCYDRTASVPAGWLYDWKMTPSEFLTGLCIEAGQSVTRSIEIKLAATSPNNLPTGSSGEVFVSFIEKEEGAISDSAAARITRRRPVASLLIVNQRAGSELHPTGVDTTTLTVFVLDEQQLAVADGVEVKLSSTLGTVNPPTALTQDGRIRAIFTAGTNEGNALITAMSGNLVATTTIAIGAPLVERLALTSAQRELPATVSSTVVTATVYDDAGALMPNQRVRIGVSGDGELGTIDGSEVLTATTNARGQVVATFTRGSQGGQVNVRAEVLVQENNQTHGAFAQALTLTVLDAVTPTEQKVYLPVVRR